MKEYKNNLVSIITPLYNAELFIEETINSVQSQTYKDWEMIVVDDCSTDKSEQIIKKIQLRDSRVRYIKLEKNVGVVKARNIAIKNSNGRYIAFLDSDDLWHAEKLEKQILFMYKNNYNFTYTGYELIDEHGTKLNKFIKVPEKLNYQKLLKGNSIGCLTVVIDQKNGEIEMSNVKHEDYATWLKLLKKYNYAYGIQENLAMYRKLKKSLSSNKFKAITWTWNIYYKNEKLGLIKSMKYFLLYILNTTLKYIKA